MTLRDVSYRLGVDARTIQRIEETGRGHKAYMQAYERLLESASNSEHLLAPGHEYPAMPVTESFKRDTLRSAPGDLFGRLLGLLQHPEMANNVELLNEERILLDMVVEQNLNVQQRFKVLSAIFGLLAERLERQNASADRS